MTQTLLLLKSIDFAAFRHRNQLRKGSGRIPYINHPIKVANHLALAGEDENTELLIAAILHDVIEDTVEPGIQKEQLAAFIGEKFGKNVLSVVLEVTDDKSLKKEERKKLQVDLSSQRSVNAKKLIIADKTVNIQDISENPPEGWTDQRVTDYFDWAERVVTNVRGLNRILDEVFDKTLAEARQKYRSEQA